MECNQWAVLHAQGAQSRAVNLDRVGCSQSFREEPWKAPPAHARFSAPSLCAVGLELGRESLPQAWLPVFSPPIPGQNLKTLFPRSGRVAQGLRKCSDRKE